MVDDWQDLDETEESRVLLADDVARQAAKERAKERMSVAQTKKYFITISRRTALRRLHLDGCFVKADRCCEVLHLDEVTSEDFDSICQACKRKMVAECGREDPCESSSTASSSSTGSADDVAG